MSSTSLPAYCCRAGDRSSLIRKERLATTGADKDPRTIGVDQQDTTSVGITLRKVRPFRHSHQQRRLSAEGKAGV